jgi:DNA invertase Pin-like site-specific DNA recombinase
MKAILYYVLLLNEEKDKKRQEQLQKFLDKHEIEVVNTYYDVAIYEYTKIRKGLVQLLDDLTNNKIQADAFICLSVRDIGKRRFLIKTLTEINTYIPMIYFADIEQSNSDDIA